MAIRDAIVLNTTGSNFEALQSGDTVRVQGDLLVQDSSGTSLLSVGTSFIDKCVHVTLRSKRCHHKLFG